MGHFKTKTTYKKIIIILRIIFICLFACLLKYVYDFSSYYKIDYKDVLEKYLGYTFETAPKDATPVFNEVKQPIIYLYSTHPSEKYSYEKINPFNIDYDVKFASYIFASYLNEYKLYSVIENKSVTDVLKDNNMIYADSYKASRILLEKSVVENPSLKYFIDIHRDSSIYEKTTCKIDNKNYAKILFVVGLEHKDYLDNLKMSESINKLLMNKNECLSRGIMKKEGKGVNGIYNQDFNKKTILLEIGGQYNTIDEVNNTLKVLATVLYEYIMEDT